MIKSSGSQNWYPRLVAVIFITALILRLAVVVAKPHLGEKPGMDWVTYTNIARNLLDGNGFSQYGTEPTTRVGPVYPGFIAGLFWLFDDSTLAVRVVQTVLGALTAVLTFLTALLLVGPTAAFIAALIVTVHPELVVLPAFLYSETLFIFLFALSVFLTVLAMHKKDYRIFAAAGVSFGVASLCRGILVPVPAFLFIAFLLTSGKWKRSFHQMVIVSIALGLVLLPWAIRNYNITQRFIPVSEGFGNEFWKGNYLPFDGRFNYKETQKAMDRIAGDTYGVEREAKLLHSAIESIKQHPGESAWLMVRKAGRLWLEVYDNVPVGAKRTPSKMIMYALGAWHFFIIGLAVIGIIVTAKNWRKLSLIYLLMLLITMVHTLTLAVPRYRLPAMLYVCMFAAVGICYLLTKAKPGTGYYQENLVSEAGQVRPPAYHWLGET